MYWTTEKQSIEGSLLHSVMLSDLSGGTWDSEAKDTDI